MSMQGNQGVGLRLLNETIQTTKSVQIERTTEIMR